MTPHRLLRQLGFLVACLASPSAAAERPARLLFEEPFEDTAFASRGWYDGGTRGGQIAEGGRTPESKGAFECHFLPRATGCAGGTPSRHLFPETDSVYIGFWIRHSDNWIGSGKPYHPHMMHLLTNRNSRYVGPAWTYLTTYVEENGGRPLMSIQDGQNITNAGTNLTGATEQRAVAGCNGDSDGYGPGDCYRCGSGYCNGKSWFAPNIYFSDSPGTYYKGDWHHVEAYFRLNSVVDGVGQKDGVLQYWYDGELLIDVHNAVLRTGQHPDMKFNQYLLAPYIGDGSPADQYFWMDDLIVATQRPARARLPRPVRR
jgi:hypothetical protein